MKHILKKKTSGLSLVRDNHFVRNIVIVVGVVFVWRGLRNIVDTYFFPDNFFLSNLFSVVIGLSLLYLPDGNLEQLGGVRKEGDDGEEKVL